MKTTFKLAIVAAAAAFASMAQADVTFGANIEHDIEKSTNTDVSNGGRVELSVMAAVAKSGDNFVNAKAALEIPTGGGDKVNIADAWVQFGNSAVDLKIGRQEAVDLSPLGMDPILVEGKTSDPLFNGGYRAGELRGRFVNGSLHAVAGLNAAPGLRVELGVVTKKEETAVGAKQNFYGLRPTVVYSAGPLTLRAGVESLRKVGAQSATGYGLSVGFAPAKDINVNANFAKSSKLNAQSVGLNATFGPAGVGFLQKKDNALDQKVNTLYAAYSIPVVGVKGATVTPGFSVSKGTGAESVKTVGVRLFYVF